MGCGTSEAAVAGDAYDEMFFERLREANRPRPYAPAPPTLVSPETYAAFAREMGVDCCELPGCFVCSGEMAKKP